MSFQIPTTTTAAVAPAPAPVPTATAGFSFGLGATTAAAAKPSSFSFGSTGGGDAGVAQPLKFGTQPTAATATTATPAVTGFGSGFFAANASALPQQPQQQQQQPQQQPTVAAVAPTLGSSTLFGAATTKPGATVAPTAATTTAASGFSFGAPAATAIPTAAPTVAGAPAAATTGFNFGAQPAAAPAAAVTAVPAAAPVSAAPVAAAPAFSLTTAKTTAVAVPALGATTTAIATPATGGFANLSTTTKTTDSAAVANVTQLSYNQIEENINKWTLELEEQEKVFADQATQINAWDKILISNNHKILELNDAVQKVKSDQQTLEQELEFIATQHKELEESIVPLQKEFMKLPQVDVERSQTYLLVENLDTQLKQMSEDLKEIIDNLNEANKGQDNTDPIIQIGKILNAHMSSLQWIESSTTNISNKLDDITKMHESFKRESERSFRSAYYS